MSIGRTFAKKIIDECGIDCAQDLLHLEDLCAHYNAYVKYEPLSGLDARIFMSEDSAIITVNADEKYNGKKRFSIGHEFGHFMLHRKQESSLLCDKKAMNEWFAKEAAKRKEIDANEFAVELLLPEKLLGDKIKKSDINFSLVDKIADEFQTTLTTTAKRIVELTDDAIAVVFYKKNGIIRHFRSELFAEQHYWVEPGPLDSSTLAYDAIVGKDPGIMQSVDVTGWFDVKKWHEDKTIKEQTRYFQNLNFGISILIIDDVSLIWN